MNRLAISESAFEYIMNNSNMREDHKARLLDILNSSSSAPEAKLA